MTQTIVAMFERFEAAQAAVEELVSAGVPRNDISLVANDQTGEYSKTYSTTSASEDVSGSEGASFGAITGALIGLGAMIIPGVGPVIAAGPLVAGLVGAGLGAAAGAVTGGLTASLIDFGVDEEYADYYAEGVRRGNTLLTVQAEDHMVDTVSRVLNQHDPVNVDTRAEEWRSSGWTGSTSGMSDSPRDLTNNEKLEVVEEDLRVGKREVEKGAVRVHTYVTETPVQQDVTLRDENVHVERRPVDRPATSSDFSSAEQTFEITEMTEEPVVSKQARVVEEVVVSKDVQLRQETINETVRRKDVDVDHTGPSSMSSQAGRSSSAYAAFDTFDSDFRTHYNTRYSNSGYGYDYYSPAYRYGYQLAADDRYRDYVWSRIEPEARRHWETSNPSNPWEDFKDSVEHAWNRVRNSLR